MIIKTKGFTIRPWKTGDEKYLVEAANNPKISRNMIDSFSYPYTLKVAMRWIKKANSKGMNNFAIVINGTPSGGIGFDIGSGNHSKRATFGYWLSEEYWGKGIVSKAAKLVCNYAFKNFDLARIEANVYPWNPASQRVLIKCGFKKEGVLRNNCIKDGKVVDEIIFSKIR